MSQSIKNVLIIGAGGNLGPAVLKALDADQQFTVSILSRKSSKSTFPSHLKVHTIDDDYPEADLVEAFKGQDAIISTIATASLATQTRLIDAAVKAGVKRFLPAEFGSNTTNQRALEICPVFKGKVEVVNYLRSQEHTGLTWTAVCTGPFFDWGLKVSFLGYDLSAHKATIWDSGDTRWSTTTLSTIGAAVAAVLHHADKTVNRYIFVADFTTSQNEVLAALEKASGKKWDVKHESTKDLISTGNEKVSKGDYSGVVPLILAAIYGGGTGGDFVKEGLLANDRLGLATQDIDTVVAARVKS